MVNNKLVGGFKQEILCSTIYGDVILPIDEFIFFKMVKNHEPDKDIPTRQDWILKLIDVFWWCLMILNDV